MLKDYIPREEIVVKSYEDAMKIVEVLLQNNYVAMVSMEEQYFVVNWIYTSEIASRNDVVFISRDEYECSQLDVMRERQGADYAPN